MEFLGFSTSMELRLPGNKTKNIRGDAEKVLAAKNVTALEVSRILGKMNEGNCYSSIILSSTTGRATTSLDRVGSKLQYYAPSIGPSEGGASMVDHPLQELEWAEPNLQETEREPGDRCRDGVSARESGQGDPGQRRNRSSTSILLGTAGSIPCLQVLLQKQEEHSCATEDGQHIGHSVHFNKMGDTVSPTS